MNRNLKKEVISLHPNKAGENKQKKSDQKMVDKRLDKNHETNVNQCQPAPKRERKNYHRQYKADQRAQVEGLNSGSPLLERTDRDFLAAKRLIV